MNSELEDDMCEPCDLSAVDARAATGANQLAPVELHDNCITRIEKLDPVLARSSFLALKGQGSRPLQLSPLS